MGYRDPEKKREYDRKYRERNKERLKVWHKENYEKNKEERLASKRESYQKHRKKRKEEMREYYKNHKEEIKAYKEANREYSKERDREYYKKRMQDDNNYKIKRNLRSRVSRAMRGIGAKSDKTLNLLGCSVEELKSHLESQFTEGMNWDNYGHRGWHIDHIKPCASFDLTDEDQQRECFNYKNLQPLWAYDNLSKGDKI